MPKKPLSNIKAPKRKQYRKPKVQPPADEAPQKSMAATEFRLVAGTKAAEFILSNRFVDVLEGPLGSGKTRALCVRVGRHAQEQSPSPVDGVRYTRFALVRNTTPDLKRSTIRTWKECYPEEVYGQVRIGSPMGVHLRYEWPLGAVDCEVDFIGLDKDEDIRKLRSTEYTGIFFDELEFVEKILFDEARSRLRYPPKVHCDPSTEDALGRRKPTWRGVCAATNAPPEDHWLPAMTGRVELPVGLKEDEVEALRWPEDWGFHLQAPALIELLDQHGGVIGYEVNPHAENLSNLPSDYYEKQIKGQRKAWIDSRLMVRVVLVTEGSAVYPEFRREAHVAHDAIAPRRGYELYCGLDFGRSPAAIFVQPINNRVFWLRELIGQGESAAVFAPKLRRFFYEHFPEHDISECHFFGDPKGKDRGQSDERNAYEVFEANGMLVRDPPGLKQNMIGTRVNAMSSLLTEMTDGKPRFIASPLCFTFNVGMAGRYCNEKDDQGELKPTKNRYSHVCNAAEYVAIGLGEGRRVTGRKPIGDVKPIQTKKRRTLRRTEFAR